MTKSEATLAAKKLLAQMTGRGWKIRVWENLGWHYSVETNRVAVYPSLGGKFHCLLKPHYTLFGSDPRHYRNPNSAVENCIAIAQDKLNSYQYILNEARLLYAK